jgi:hypothetical protein
LGKWKDFFLTGGSALVIFYLEHRLSYDLDFFLQKTGWDLKKLVAEVSHKEGGVQPAILSWLLSQIRFEHAPEYLIILVSA